MMTVNGLPLSDHVHKNVSFNPQAVHYGAVVGSYALLELLGFAFLHPLEPHIPTMLRLDSSKLNHTATGWQLDLVESPYWPERGFHLHTQHPLELTEVLQGHDIPQFGPHGPHCRAHSKRFESKTKPKSNSNEPYCERWEDMVADVDVFFEWAVANRLNKVEWLLLDNYKWGDELSRRHFRLSQLTDLGHKYSLLIGADVPLGNIQQHGWYIVNVRLSLEGQRQQIRERVDWLCTAGFDFITTESGLSEFTHPECGLMVDLMNLFAEYVNGTWGREAAIKVHCSTGQTCETFLDPRTGDPANFNFLPTFAHPSMGIFPHTVQMYALDDPTAGSYGNANFSYIEDYLVYEAKLGQRAVMFYGETSYWVNVDIDVPLFLPIYGQRRQRDLRRIARRERAEGFRMHGQMNFDSGWEWGYWISDVITARSSWNPIVPSVDENCGEEEQFQYCSADQNILQKHTLDDEEQWNVFYQSLYAVTHIFGSRLGDKIRSLLVSLSRDQARLLLFGLLPDESFQPERNLKKVNGIAYLSGFDTWVDLPRMFGLSFTQPDKVHLKETNDPLWPRVLLLLSAMEDTFLTHANMADLILEEARKDCQDSILDFSALQLIEEIRDCVRMLFLRSRQVHLLYSARDKQVHAGDNSASVALLKEARNVLAEAEVISARREEGYRVSWRRIASWRENPTVYRHGYLWSVRKLYFWWRDQGLAEQESHQSEHSPCYLNRIDSTEVAIGWGKYTLELLRTFVNRYTPFSSIYPLEIVNCLSPPSKEYDFPRDLVSFVN
eukprot:scaffold659_cov192-Ochromonas_danica.AAC.63